MLDIKMIQDIFENNQQYELINLILDSKDLKEKCTAFKTLESYLYEINSNDEPFIKLIQHLIYYTTMDYVEYKYKTTTSPKERDLYSAFKENYITVLGEDYEIIKNFNFDEEHIPDFMLRNIKTNKFCPVEIKKDSFNRKALKQLLRYIEFYKCETGIAIGSKLTVTIEDNIRFYSIEQIENI